MPSSSELPPLLSAQATASTPRDKPIVLASAPAGLGALPAVERVATSPKVELAAEQAVATLAAARKQDAVEWAMAPHPLPISVPALAASKPHVVANLDPQAVTSTKHDGDLWIKPKPEPAAAAKPDAQPASATKPEPQPQSAATAEPQPAAMTIAETKPDATPAALTIAKSEMKPDSKPEAASAEAAKPDLPTSLAQSPAPPAPTQMASADPAPASDTSLAPTPVMLPTSAAMPVEMVPLPRVAPGAPPLSPAERLHLDEKNSPRPSVVPPMPSISNRAASRCADRWRWRRW